MFKKSLVWILMLAMLLCTAVLGVSASEVSNGSSEQQVGTTVSAPDEASGSVKSSQKYYQLPNGETVAYPDATVSVKAPVVLTPEGDDYMVWPSGDDTVDRPLQIVMNFRANQTEEEASATIFGNWKCDFYLNFDGLAEGRIVADDCYLAGNYGSFGWIVIPADGLELEEGIDYPVVAAYDANLKYAQDICGSVKDFTAAIYVAPAILEANPDFKVSLSLKMTDPENEDNVITIGEPAVYDKYSLGLSAGVAQPEENGFAATANEAAVEAAKTALEELGVTETELANAKTVMEITIVSVPDASGKIVYNVAPTVSAGNKSVKVSSFAAPVTFRLPVNSGETKTFAKVYHEGELLGTYAIVDENGSKYVEVSSKNFSEFAVEPTLGNIEVTDNEGNVTYLANLKGFNASNCTIKLLADVGENNLNLNKATGVVLDLNGFTFSKQINLNNGASLTIKDGSAQQTGKVIVDKETNNSYAVVIIMRGTLVVEGGTFENVGASGVIQASSATLSIEGGKFVSQGNGIELGTWVVSSSKFPNNVTISGGTIIAAGDGIVDNERCVGTTIEITGGSIQSAGESINVTTGEATVSGGSFSKDVSDYLADGFVLEENADGSFGAVEDPTYGKVAKIGDTYFATLAEAFAAVRSDYDTVVILADVTENMTTAYLRGNIVTADGANVTITLTNTDWVYLPYTFVIGEGITLKIPNGGFFYYAGGSVIEGTVITDAYYQMYRGTKLTVKGTLTVTSETFILRYTEGDPDAGIYVDGGTLNASVIYFYQGTISAKNGATINTAVYWQTNETDSQGSANLVLDNATMNVTVSEQIMKATGNSTVTLKNDSSINAQGGYAGVGVLMDATSSMTKKNGASLFVAKVGDKFYTTAAAAIAAAQDGAVIEILEGFSGVAIKVEGKSVTIKGAVTLNDVSITGSTDIELTVEGLSFTGNSWIDSCGAAALTVKGVTANVAPSNSTATNSRSAFISLGRTEDAELDLTIESCDIVITANGPDAVLGWAKVNEVAIKDSTFGSKDYYFNNGDAIKFMSIADGAVFTIEGNTVYSNYNGIVFGQNTTRGNAYTVNVKDNTFFGGADHIWVEVSGANTCHASINASSDNTVNGNAFTAKDIKLHPNLNSFTGYLGVDVEFDAEDKIIGGSFIEAPAADLLADSYEANKGADGTYSIIKCLAGSGTEANPYLINNIADLILFRDSVNAGETKYNANGVYVALAADIDLKNAEWAPIGTKTYAFKGIFDGNEKTIENLKITSGDYVGLFGVINTPAVVKNVTVKNVSITGSSYVGGIVGMAYTGKIEGCSVEGKINIQGHYMVGGITGHGYAKIYDCSVIGEGTGNYITATYKAANLEGDNVGGIVGHNAENNDIIRCTVKNVTVSGTRKVGGIVGITAQNGRVIGCTVSGITVETTATAEYAADNAKTMGIGGLIGQFQASGSNNGEVSGCKIENVAFNNVNGVSVSIGAVTGGLRGSSNSTVKPADTIDMENISIDAASMAGTNNLFLTSYVAKIGGNYYATFEAVIAAAQAGDEITLLADIEASDVILIGKSLTINGNGHKITSTATRVIRVTASNVEVTLNAVNMVSRTVMTYPNDIRGISVDPALTNVQLTLNNCSVDFTDASACDWAYAVNVSGNGTGHTLTVNGGSYEGANVINVHGASNTVIVKGATLTSLYPNNDVYFGAGIWVLQNQGSSVEAKDNVFNGSNAIAFNLGTGTTLTESNNTDNMTKVVAKIDTTYYTSLEDAFKAATNGCTIEILADITIDGKWDCRDYAAGGSHSQFKESVTINGNGHTLKFTGTINDSNWFTIFRFEENATVNNLTIDISEATGAQRVITAKKSLTVDDLTIIGAARYGVIFGEGATADDLAATEIVIKNSTLTGTRRAISDNEGGKDVKSIVVTDNTLKANVYLSASESVKFSNNVANGEVDVRSYTSNTLSVEALGNTLTSGVKNFISAKTLNVQEGFAKQYKVSTKAELNAALAAAKDGDAIVLVADIDYGTDQLAITKAITFDLGGKTLTTRNAYGGMSVKGNPTIKNGTIVHASNTAAIKVWNAVAFEDLIIDVQGKGDANKTIGGIVLQSGTTTRVGSIKNVTIKGAALTNGIETYNCGDATENVIGSMTNVTIDAVGTGLLISAPCGTATNCQISGDKNGIEIFIKGNYSASLELVDSSVEGGVYAHDEFSNNPSVVNDGKLSFVVDQDTVVDDITLTLARAENVEGELKEIKDNAEAKVNNTYYATIAAAINAAQDGDTVTIAAGEFGAINISNKNITIQGTVGANGELLTTIKGGNPAIVGHRFNGTIQNIKIVDAFKVMYAEPAGNVTVDNVYVTGATYGFHLVAYSTNLTWKIQNSYMDLSWANSFGVHGGDAAIIITGNVFESTSPYYPDAGARVVNTFLPNVTVKDNFFGENTKIFVASAVTDTSKIVIAENYHADGLSEALASGGQVVFIPSYYTDEAMQNLVTIVAKVGDTFYGSFADALAAAKAGDEVTLYTDVALSADVTLPAGIILNGNGKSITGATVWAGGDLTFKGYTKMATFNAGYGKPVITIGEGATLEMTTGRMVIGHGATFNIVGTITDAKTANVADLVPSLIIPGASFTGVGVNFNVTNAYVKFTAYCSSKNSNANGTFNINVENSIWEQTNTLVFSEPTSGKDPTFNFTLKDSVLNSTSHLVFGVTKGEIVFDNSNVNVGAYRQLENRSTLTIKNGSVVYAAHATSSNAKNPGTTIVENATYMATGDFTGSDVGIGTLILKKGANVTMGKITKANIVVDATGMTAGEIGLTANLSALAGTVSTINSNVLEAMIVDGKLVLAERTLLGSGTEADPYLIYNIADLLLFRDSVNAGETKYNADGVYVALAADIDMAGIDWSVNIGDDCSMTFDGIFDGKNFTIKNLTSTETAQKGDGYVCTGLFGAIYGNAVIKNLTIEDAEINAQYTGNNAGVLVGFVWGGNCTIENVTVKNATVNASGIYGVGAVVGYVYYSSNLTIKDCTVVGTTITAVSGAGAVVGHTTGKVSVENCTVDGTSVQAGAIVGGIAGVVTDGFTATGSKVKNVTLTVTKPNWVNSTGIVVGSMASNVVTVSGTVYENVNETAIVGSGYAEHPDFVVPAVQAKIGNKYYTTLAKALEAANAGDTIVLLTSVVVNAGETLTLDKAVTITYTSNVPGEDMITNRGTLIVDGAKLVYVNTDTTASNVTVSTISSEAGSVLEIKSGEVRNDSANNAFAGIYAYAIDLLTNGTLGDVTATISGGNVISTNYMAIRQFNNGTACKNTLTVEGGYIYGAKRAIQIHMDNNAGILAIKGGKIEAGNYALCLFPTTSTNIAITGGTFVGTVYSGTNGIISGGTFDEAVYEGYCAAGYIPTKNADGTFGVKVGVFTVRNTTTGVGYETLAEAIAAAQEGDTVVVLAGTHSEGTVKLPATLVNVTIKGEAGAILKDTTISAADGNSYKYVGLTFDGLTFDNSRILLTGWRNGEETIKDLTVTNCTFKNLNDNTNTAPVHINKDASEAVNGFVFTNNVIDGATGGSKSGVYLQATGNVVFKNNVINNVSFRPYVVQLTTDDGIADTFTVKGNTFSGSAVGRAQGLANNAAGTDAVTLVVTGNIFKGITDSQQICYWNFNAETTTADMSGNYYDINILNNPSKIYFNQAATNANDLINMGVYPYYADEAMTQKVEAPAIMVIYTDGKIEYYENMIEAVPYTTNCPRLEGATIVLLKDVQASGMRFMENDMVFDLNGHTFTITAGTGSQGTNTSGFQIRPEVTTDVIFKNGTINVAAGAPVVWMFNCYATSFVVENVTVDCTNMAWSYGSSCYVVVNREGDNVVFVNTVIKNFNSAVAGYAYSISGTMEVGENVILGGTVELGAGATLTAPAGVDVVAPEGYKVVYANGVYSLVKCQAKIGNVYYATFAEAVAAAQAGDEIVILVAGQYSVPTGKNLTITGAVAGVEFSNIGAHGMAGASVTFNNVTFNYAANSTYKGLQHSGNLVYNNCTFNGQVFLYGASETFNNCVFNQTDADNYNVWTYSADEVTFNKCTFNSAGKSVLIYVENATEYNKVNVIESTFVASSAVEGKAAIEMDSSLAAGIELTVDAATTVSGFGTGNVSGNSLWNNKKGNNTDANNDITVVVADETVLAPVTFVAKIGNIGYTSFQAAMNAAAAGDIVELFADVKLTGKYTITKAVTIDGNGHSIIADETAVWYTVSGKFNIKNYKTHLIGINSDGVTLKDVVLDCNNNAAGINVYVAQNVVFDNVSIINATKGTAALTVNGSTVTFKNNFVAKGNSVALDISNGTGVTSPLGVTVEEGTTFDADNKVVKFADGATVDVEGAVDANNEKYFASRDNAYFYTEAQMNSRTSAYSNGLTLLKDVTMTRDLSFKGTLDLNGYSITFADGKGVVSGQTGYVPVYENGKYVIVKALAKLGEVYYATFEEAIAAAQAGDEITLLADIEASEVILIGKSLTINGNGHKITSTATRVIRVTASNVEVTLNAVNMVSRTVMTYPNDIRGISVDPALTNVKLTLNNCSVDFTDASACDWAYAVNVSGNGTGHTLTVNGGSYEGANVINVHGANNTVIVKGATLTSLYPNNDLYYGAGIWVLQNQGSSVVAENNVFNGSNAIAFNLGTGTTLTESNNTDNMTMVVAKIVTEIGTTYYTSLEDAFKAATADCEIVILHNVVIDYNWDARYTGAKFTVPVTINGNGKTIKFTAGVNDNNHFAAFRFEADATVKNLTVDMRELSGRFRAISAKADLTVEGCTFIGNGSVDNTRAIIFGEGAGAAIGEVDVSITNSKFEGWKRAITDNENAQDAKTVTITGNIMTDAGVYVSASESVVFTGNTVEGAYVSITAYTAENLSVTATGNMLTANSAAGYNSINAATVNAQDEFLLPVAQIGAKKYFTLQEAINKAAAGDTIALVVDVVLEGTVTVPAGKEITLDLAGYTVSLETANDTVTSLILNYGNLTITDSSDAQTGKLSYKYTGTNSSDAYNTVESAPGSVLTVKGGKIENLSANCLIAYAIDGLTNANGGDVIVNVEGGEITSMKQAIRIFANSTTCTGYLNISGGTMFGRVIIQNASAKANKAALNITGGIFNVNSYKSDVLYVGGSQSATVDMVASVSGGTFNGAITDTQVTGFISGGKFIEAVEEAYCAEGYIPTENADGTFGVKVGKYVVRNATTGVGYESFAEAIAAAQDGDIIKLVADQVYNGYMIVDGITLDLNGQELTVNGALIALKGASLIDSQVEKGKLKVASKNSLVLSDVEYPMLPIWVDDGYVFAEAFVDKRPATPTQNGFEIRFRPLLLVGKNNEANKQANAAFIKDIMADGIADNGLTIEVFVHCMRGNVEVEELHFVIDNENVDYVYDSTNRSFTLTLKGATDEFADKYVVTVAVKSDRGISFETEICTFIPTTSSEEQ